MYFINYYRFANNSVFYQFLFIMAKTCYQIFKNRVYFNSQKMPFPIGKRIGFKAKNEFGRNKSRLRLNFCLYIVTDE